MAVTINGTNGVTFNDSSSQGTAALGFTQTWQNMTASRALATTYTNSSGRTIVVSMYTNGDAYTGARLFINGSIFIRDEGGYHPGYAAYSGVFGIIPNGATYKIEGGPSMAAWWELR